MIKVNDVYSVIKGSDNPLSSDVAIIKGNKYNWIFDVGANEEILAELKMINNKVIIISHFHQDHFYNFNQLTYQKLFVSEHLFKYTHDGEIIKNDIYLEDKYLFHLFILPNSHAKGSVALEVEDYVFVGDALGPQIKNNQLLYNTQLLKEEIEILESLKANYIISSHNMDKPMLKEEVINKLKQIYQRKEKNSPYIMVNEDC